MEEVAIRCEGLTRFYGEVKALDHLGSGSTPGCNFRFPWPQRRRENHHHAPVDRFSKSYRGSGLDCRN